MRSDGTFTTTSTRRARRPPERPDRPTTPMPHDRAASTAATTFGELPLAEIATRRSPGRPRDLSCSENTRSYPLSLAHAVSNGTLSVSETTWNVGGPSRRVHAKLPIRGEREHLRGSRGDRE